MRLLKKIWIILAVTLNAFVLSACSQEKTSSTIELQDQVDFTLLDVLKIENDSTNMVYYYFLAGIENNSKSVYHMSNLEYRISEQGTSTINAIDRFQSTISEDIKPDTSTFVYGYIGYPDANERNVGLEFPRSREFLPFNSVAVRNINDDNVVNSTDAVFTVYEDEYFSFQVDSSDIEYSYADGISTVSGLKITYLNKTDDRLVVPYLTPVCTLAGIDLNDLKNADELKKMDLEELKKQEFSENHLPAKTTNYTGSAFGYQLYYLTANQEYTCTIDFEFEEIVPDFQNDTGHAISISINSAALGYMQNIPVDY